MVGQLLSKDLRRAWRNPLPYLIQLAIPLCITGVIGLAFGPKEGGQPVAAIKVAVVDEDDTPLSDFLTGSFNQGEGRQFLDPQIVDRTEAMGLIEADKISAVIVIPKGFTDAYLDGGAPPPLELIKNPAQSYYPAIIEEMMDAAIEGLNALRRTFGPELREVKAFIFPADDERPSLLSMATLLIRLEAVFERIEDYLFPPRVAYRSEERAEGTAADGPAFNIFGFVLSGMSAMFMLFIAGLSLADIFKERKGQTLARMRTLMPGVLPIVTGKVLFTVLMVMGCAVILFGGGGLLFGVSWGHPLKVAVLCVAYGFFCAGLMACLAALAGNETRMNVFSNLVIFAQAFVGGTMFPVESLPAVLRDHVTPLVPLYWFSGSIRALENGVGGQSWVASSLLLGLTGLGLVVLAAGMLNRLLRGGART
jgi:ABC-type polysaccharide/polyol phosphate export permease